MTTRVRGEDYARLVLVTIRDVREEHHACTAREIARRLGVSHPLVCRQLDTLVRAELVAVTKMPGAIWLTGKGGKVASGGKMPQLGPGAGEKYTDFGDAKADLPGPG